MSIWYRARWDEVTAVEVEKETSDFITINGRRNAKRNTYEAFFPTYHEAVDYIIQTAVVRVEQAENALLSASQRLDKLRVKYDQ